MTMVNTYSAECGNCGNVELVKFSLTSGRSFMPLPDMDFSSCCIECSSESIKIISSEEAMEKRLKQLRDKQRD